MSAGHYILNWQSDSSLCSLVSIKLCSVNSWHTMYALASWQGNKGTRWTWSNAFHWQPDFTMPGWHCEGGHLGLHWWQFCGQMMWIRWLRTGFEHSHYRSKLPFTWSWRDTACVPAYKHFIVALYNIICMVISARAFSGRLLYGAVANISWVAVIAWTSSSISVFGFHTAVRASCMVLDSCVRSRAAFPNYIFGNSTVNDGILPDIT